MAVPKNIHTHSKEGKWNFQRGGGGGWGGGVQTKTWEGYGYFLNSTSTLNTTVKMKNVTILS